MAEATVDEIRERNDIVEVISRYVTLTKAGARFKALCPFHQEKTPSFSVNREKQAWYCFGCHEGGDVFDFIQKIEKVSFPEAAEQLASRVGLTFARSSRSEQDRTRRQLILQVNARAAQFFHNVLVNEQRGRSALDQWQARGIDGEILARFRLGYALDSWDALWTFLQRQRVAADIAEAAGLVRRRQQGSGYYDYFRNRLMVPIRDVQGQVIAFGGRTAGDDPAKYINSPESETFRKGQVLFGLDVAARNISELDAAIIVEGYMDQIALYQFGFENCVATMGTAVTADHLRKLSRYTRNLFVAFDADSAGMNAVLRSAALFDQYEMKVRIVEVPEGYDPDEFVRKRGAEAFAQALQEALTLIDYRIRQATQTFVSRHDGSGAPEGFRGEMIRAVVPILLDVKSPISLKSLVHRLAQEWCAPDLHRVTAAEQAIQQEIALTRTRHGHVGPAQPPIQSTLGKSGVARPSMPLTRPASGLVKAEREILAAILQGHVGPDILERLPPNRFIDEIDQLIAKRLHTTWLAGGADSTDWFREAVQLTNAESTGSDPERGLRKVVSELLVQDVKYLDKEDAVDDRVQKILGYWSKLEAKQKREAIAQKLDSGESVGQDEYDLIREMTVAGHDG